MPALHRQIIHVDMDCFYAAIEERDDPRLRGHPVGVGGDSRRGVLTTANYEARKFGCHSAMPVHEAMRLCPQLIVVPTRFEVYRRESGHIRALMRGFTQLIEPLSLDEAFLDVSARAEPAAEIALHLRSLIREDLSLTASAGIGPNKLIAKIASDLNKPDGQVEVGADQVSEFLRDLPVRKLWGVGPQTGKRLARLGIESCGQLRNYDPIQLVERLGRHGLELRALAAGVDDRPVQPHRESKSSSVESTFSHNLETVEELEVPLSQLHAELDEDLVKHHSVRRITALVVKLKFADFTSTTAERSSSELDRGLASELLLQARARQPSQPIRLLGIGVKFAPQSQASQLDLF